MSVYQLHVHGFEIHNLKSDVDPRIKSYTKGIGRIFNGEKNDGRRLQAELSDRYVENLEQELRRLYPNHTPNDWVTITSKAGCGQQMAHCDYVPSHELGSASDDHFPLACLYAIEEGTHIRIWPHSIRYACMNPSLLPKRGILPIDLYLEVGEFLVFRGDLIHAGSSYEKSNTRIHCFLDVKNVLRDPNRTWIIRNQYPEIRDLIIEDVE